MRVLLYNLLFLLKRFRTSSILNIIGLSVAFAVFYAIIVRTYYDLSFDRNFEKADNIYLYTTRHNNGPRLLDKTNTQTPKELAGKFPEIKNSCFMKDYGKIMFEVEDSMNNLHEFHEKLIRVGGDFIDMFIPNNIIMGDARQIFTANDKAMLTESMARKFFGNDYLVGKSLVFHQQNRRNNITVVAICKDFPDNCSFENGVYLNQPERLEGDRGYTSYLELIPGNKDKLLTKINKEYEKTKTDYDNLRAELIPLPDIHLKFPGKGGLGTTLSLLATGLWLMIIAYINFVNFSIAMAPVRLKGFNIRRILGENPLFLKFSIAVESTLISFVAFLLSLLFIHYFKISVSRDFLQVDLSLSKNISPLLLAAGASIIMGFLVGIYPAFHATTFNPAIALNGSFSTSFHSKALKNTLIVFQFITAVFTIIVAFFIKYQHDYMQNKPWGLTKENVVYFQIGKMPAHNRKVFAAELKENPDIIDIALSTCVPSETLNEISREYGGKWIKMKTWETSANILNFFDINLVEGRDFEDEDCYGTEKIICNMTAFKDIMTAFKDANNNVIGTDFACNYAFTGGMTEIVGVMEDFHFQSLHKSIQPMAFVVGKDYTTLFSNYMLIKINGKNRDKTVNYINDTWKKFSKEFLDLHFLDETINKLYEKENNLAKLLTICGLITIIVAIMGVYGLILFNAKSKRKTIALHKVHGASIMEVILMLNRGFLIQFAVAYIIAVPVAYYAVNRWLENFAYKTPMYWWV
ncbi:MAG: hypothetical protein LBG80_15855, partial [Bacteroidales bacterium]|nr:hypothetical protein [Bacteroidales bacterium]